ncbi:glutaredoxin [Pengzhenrongella frigida]|uniref:Glutaredoxin n=1 Tax=Pengzhenrongella frigida TaxID=1259133 RepID=A0A4Q5MVD4_9MICO|nr:glutaredoxin [Cellulomonas sp. HLT2-17]RYV49480.1 glutaredoxin [Cellulomonas sp. HLT2-17]
MFGKSTRTAQDLPRGATWVDITVVHAPACHFCDDAEQSLSALAKRFPLALRVVALESDEGRLLTAKHRPAMSPLVLVDGRFFSAGRLPRKKLTALLEQVAVEHAVARDGSPMGG